MKIKNIFLFFVLFKSLTCTTYSSDKYTVDEDIVQIKDIDNAPTLQHLCKQVVRKDWSEKIDTAFKIAKKPVWSDTDTNEFTDILQYNQDLQHPCVAAHAQFPSIFDIKNNNNKKISDCLIEQQNSQAFTMALNHGLTVPECKQASLENLHAKASQAFHLAEKKYWDDADTEKFTDILVTAEDICRNALIIANISLPSIFHFNDKYDRKIINYITLAKNSVALRLMLDHGLDLYTCYNRQNSLLHEAVYKDADDCVQLILSYKKQGKNYFDQQTIDEQDRHDKLQLLHMPNAKGGTPLTCAVEGSSLTITQLLLSANADVNQHSKDSGKTALHWAAAKNVVQVIPLLLTTGAEVNELDHDGETALHYAARYNRENIALPLIDAGANINQVNDKGKTPLFEAEQNNANLVIPLLIAAGGWVTEPVTTHTYNLRSKKRKLS